MVYKVLSIVSGVLFSLMGLAFAVCLVWTLATAAVREGFETVSGAVDQMVADAMGAMEVDWGERLMGALGSVGASGEDGRSGATGGFDLVGSLTSLVNGSGGAELAASDFADPAQGQAYLTWKGAVDDPVGRIFEGTEVSSVLLEGVAGGSASASGVLEKLDEAALAAIASNASKLASTAAGNAVPANLPEGARALMWEANAATQGFASSVQSLVTAVRGVKAGSAASLGELVSAANALVGDLQTAESCMEQAEALLLA